MTRGVFVGKCAITTDAPSVLGIKPIPNIQEKIQKMIAKYRAETLDIEDVEYEEADLEEDVLFAEDDDKNTLGDFKH